MHKGKTNNWIRKLMEWLQSGGSVVSGRSYCVPDDGMLPLGLASLLARAREESLLVVTDNADEAEKLASSYEAYRSLLDEKRLVIPVPEVSLNRRQWMPENEASRCVALDAAINHVPGIYVSGVQVLLSSVVSPKDFQHESLSLEIGQEIAPETLVKHLVELDYDNEIEVSLPGEFSWRGGIVDVYSPLYDAPVRIEYFGNIIDGMRLFSPDSQRSYAAVDKIRIIPRGSAVAVEDASLQQTTRVLDFFVPSMRMILVNPRRIVQQLEQFGSEEMRQQWAQCLEKYGNRLNLISDIAEQALLPSSDVSVFQIDSMDGLLANVATVEEATTTGGIALWHWQMLRDNLLRWHKEKYSLVACCPGDGENERFAELLSEDKLTSKLPMNYSRCGVKTGVVIPEAKLVLLSDSEIFGRRNVRRLIRPVDYQYANNLRESMELEDGVLAVHLHYGICIYHGISVTDIDGEQLETIELEFANNARIFVPLDETCLISRYVGGSKIQPELSSPGGNAWNRSKQRAADAAWGLASELLRLEAMRQAAKGVQFHPSLEWERAFAGAFQYATTRDQQEAIDACLRDMDSDRPMDRLLCGDVGYGKTEVALRAAFRAVMNGYQVAVLVPTTVLAQQHFQTFRERMAEFPVNVGMLSRFCSRVEQTTVLEKLFTGKLDVIIGTHRLLQKDVKFASLGLLIIDEEQRFGVKDKQRMKELRASLDVLTMTATPIPRTLYMSLSGIRNLSTIMTAPSNRLPVQTIVAYFDKELICQAISRELERKGQVFFLYNRVGDIEAVANVLREMLPNARFAVAHGQMSPLDLERIMTKFVAGEYDVLVSTTIIESGIDIPNANTIIIDRADRFGLSELYQLRGRVGRDFRQGYAYLLLPPMGVLPENARQRLAAIKRYTHLGAGFKLAMKDLEIRGAGNILGEEQSGHIAAVGFELYCSLLQEAVAKLEKREIKIRRTVPVMIDFITSSLVPVAGKLQAVIPPEYVEDAIVRINFYKRLENVNECKDLEDLKKEMIDRFGHLPEAVDNLFALQNLKLLASQKHLLRINCKDGRFVVETKSGLLKINGSVPIISAKSLKSKLQEIVKIVSEVS